MVYLPFILARDNTGFIIVDVKNKRALKFSTEAIQANLFGHGSVLLLEKSAQNRIKIVSVIQTLT